MDGLRVSGHGSLLEGLGQGRVGVTCAGNILARSTVFHSKSSLSNHLASIGSNDVGAQDTVSLGVGQNLDHAVGVGVGLGTGVGAEGEGADAVRDVLVLEFLLVLANPGNLRVGVHDRGNNTVVDVAVALLEIFDSGNSLLLSLVSQHRTEGHIANAANVGDLGAVLGIDNDTATLIELEANVLQAQALGIRSATDGNQDGLGFELDIISY